MIKLLSLLVTAAVATSVSESSYVEAPERYTGILSSEYGNSVLVDELDLLDESEEKNICFAILEAVEARNISVGVISSEDISSETADMYYSQISEDDADFALMLFNENDYSYYFYGSAAEEFEDDEDAFWMTDNYISDKLYFIAGVQFPLDVQYHTVSEPAYTEEAETTTQVVTESVNETVTDVNTTETVTDGIHTVTLENGHTALLHDLDDSLTESEEAAVLSDIMSAVRENYFSIGIVITDDIGDDKSDYGVMDFADVYYEKYCGIDTNGIFLLINNDTKYDWVSTSGKCIDVFDYSTDSIIDTLYDYLVDGNYSLACQRFVQEVKYYSQKADEYYDDYYDDYYDVDFDGETVEDVFSLSGFGIIIAIIAVAIFAGSLRSSYRMKKNVSAANYKLENSLLFTQCTDTFLRTYTTRRRISSSSSSGSHSSRRSGGSRSHRSSGGGRHGGSGRRR